MMDARTNDRLTSLNHADKKRIFANSISFAIHFLLILFWGPTLLPIASARVSDKIYSNLQSNHYCSRRLNATHQVGCSSELGGNLGIVWVVERKEDLEHILHKGPTPPYIAVLRREHYTRENLITFKNYPDRVSGVVLFDDDTKSRTSPFSPEDTCPNRYSGLYVNDTQYGDCKQNQWLENSPISGLLYDDIPYPIFLINEKKSIDEIESCFTNYNIVKGSLRTQDTYPLCGIQLDSFMMAASNTKNCLNSRSLVNEITPMNSLRCNTIDNYNIFAYYKPTHATMRRVNDTEHILPALVESQSIVMLVAKLSSLSMFTDSSPGADSTITSIVTLLATAEALGRVRNSSEVTISKRNIAFALIDAEPFDYTGSSRMIYSMNGDTFPNGQYRFKNETLPDGMMNLNLTALDYVLNLDQMASYPKTNEIYLHTDPKSKNSKKLDKILGILKKNSADYMINFKQADPKLPLPPTSVQEFIRHSQTLAEEKRLFGLVLSNYEKKYSNLFYDSIYDDSHNIYQNSKEKLVEHISQVAGFVAKSLYQLAFGKESPEKIIADKVIIEELLECYLKNATCGLFTKAWRAGQQLPEGPIQTYKDSTMRSDDMNGAITRNLLLYFIGEKLGSDYDITRCIKESANSYVYDYEYINGKKEPISDGKSGECIRSQVVMPSAQSPAYARTDSEITVDPEFPAWTVSYNNIRYPVRIFIKPSPIHQWCVFLLGIVITGMSHLVVYKIRNSISRLQSENGLSAGTST